MFYSALLVLLVPIINTLELNTVFTKCIACGCIDKSVKDIIIEGVLQPEDLHAIRRCLDMETSKQWLEYGARGIHPRFISSKREMVQDCPSDPVYCQCVDYSSGVCCLFERCGSLSPTL